MKMCRYKKALILGIILLIAVISTNDFIVPVKGATREDMPEANVLLLCRRGTNPITVALGLDDKIQVTKVVKSYTASDDLRAVNFANIDVVIIDSFLPEGSDLAYLISRISSSKAGVLFFGGKYPEASVKSFSRMLPVDIDPYEVQNDEYFTVELSEEQANLADMYKTTYSMFATRIAWTSMTIMYDRTITYGTKSSAVTIAEITGTSEPVISFWTYMGSKVFYISMGTIDDWNDNFDDWAYFNYLMYIIVYSLYGLEPEQIETYREWPWSPIPHLTEIIIWIGFLVFLWVFNFVFFLKVGKKKKSAKSKEKTTKSTVPDKEKI